MEIIIKKLKEKSCIFHLITIFIFSMKIIFSDCNCDLNTPIKKNGECQLIYCTEEEYKNENCIIDNDIIKTQWLNSIIFFDSNKYRYGSIAVNSKGDMIAEFSTEENNGIRLFYGLKKDGNYYFKNSDNSETPTKLITIQKDNQFSIRYESNNIFISLNTVDDSNEYLMSISIYTGNVELYDLESNVCSFIQTIDFTGYLIYTFLNQIIKLNDIDGDDKKQYLNIIVGQKKDDCVAYQNFYLVLQIYSFSKINININDGYTIEDSYEMYITAFRSVSGYVSDSNLIVIFYFYNAFNIATFNYNLEKILDNPISQYIESDSNMRNTGIFFKCIYLKGDLGVFAYFSSSYDSGPTIKIERITINNNYYQEVHSFQLSFESISFKSDPRLSDLTRINDNRFSYVSCSKEKTILYILLFDLYNADCNVKMRMYRIYLDKLYNLLVYMEITTSLYNNYLVVSFSACNASNCPENPDYFSLLMIFSYINGTDSFIDIYPYLKENINDNGENITNNLITKLQENIRIDNNIFGYELVNEIKLIDFPSSLNFYNKTNGAKLLVNKNGILSYNYEIEQVENCLKNFSDIYYIEHQFIVKEPSYEQFNLYPINIVDYPQYTIADQSSEFEEKIFYSRVNKVSFRLCNENCKQCYYLGTSNNHKCFSCFNDSVVDSSGNCVEKETDVFTTKTESNLSDNTDFKETEDIQQTNENTEQNKNTEITEKIETEKLTEATETEKITEVTETTQLTEIAETTEIAKKTEETETEKITVATETTQLTETAETTEIAKKTEATETEKITEATETTQLTEAAETTEIAKKTEATETEKITKLTETTMTEKTEKTNINDCQKYYIDKNTKEIICLSMKDNCPINYPFYNETSGQCMETVSFENLLKTNFSSYSPSEEKDILYNLFTTSVIQNYTGDENLIISTQDSNVFQLTNTLNELNSRKGATSNNYSLSMIDLGECGEALKSKYHIYDDTPLIIFKLEKPGEVASKRNIQYEVYDPKTKQKMDLSICDDEKIDIYIPVSLSEEIEELHSDLLNNGYDLFNPNDSFYQDICTPYTTINGTDIILSDRRSYYYNDTETSCQEGCEYSEYSSETKHLKCECMVNNNNISTKATDNDNDEKLDTDLIVKSFYDVLKYSNYKVLKCYNLVFNLELLKINYGSMIFISYFILYTIFNIFFFAGGMFKVKVYISKIISESNNKNSNKNVINNASNNNNLPLKRMKSRRIIYKKNIKMPPKRMSNVYIDKTSSEKSFCLNQYSNANNNSKDMNLLKRRKTKARNSVLIFNKKRMSQIDSNNKSKKGTRSSLKETNVKSIQNKRNSVYNKVIPGKRNSIIKTKKKTFFSLFRGNNFSDFELNELEYKLAVEYDKRSFFEYYWSLIRREHLIFHTFFSFDDYNIFSIKLSKCVFSIALDFALNVMFFFDDSMRKIYLDYGKYNIIAQFPQSLYSTIVSESIDILLRYLSLTEKDIYRIKQLEKKKRKDINIKIFKILRCIKVKFFGYFIFSTVFLAFFWYFVSAFCAVYRNTQMFLFKDSFMSLFLSLLYPFGLYLVPSSLRTIALRDKKKSSKCLYNSSDIIPLI